MNVVLPKDLEEFVAREVNEGRYASAEEVIGEALRILIQKQPNEDPDQAALPLHNDRYKVADAAFWQSKIDRVTQKFGKTDAKAL